MAEVISEELAHKHFLHYHDAAVDRLSEVCRNAPVVKKGKKNEREQRKCAVCVQAKMKIRPYLNNAFRHSSPGDLVHVDLAQIKQLSERGFKYLMVMVDDHSRYVQAYFLKKKSIAPKAFMHYCTAIRMPKAVRTDGGAELIAGTWKAFCEQHQIRQEQSLPHHQSQNGVAERTIGAICQLTRAALFQSGLPSFYWCFAAKTATYIKNRMPTKRNPSEKTPFELFWGYPLCIRHIRTFGARAYVRQRKDQRGKLDPRAKLGILVGFDPNTKDGYVMWFPDDRQFVISRDVEVDEHVRPSHLTSRPTTIKTTIVPSNPKMIDSIKKMSVSTNTAKIKSLTALHCAKDRQQHHQYRRPLKMLQMQKKPSLIPMEVPLTTIESFERKWG
ncbi:unnamed protein product [Vitrella brassicaformis CCMP3155]|uniref:Integrase catalytic domain-containing protein n=1 Tax=Vitrella brassicaformis (strain CCMP3155) TaxID=1169540 RepID=A0A0G4GWT4_VITBC|nr:unnamed protein product [Vitrella brassicaformis CCMP3155]|eukprot:CEM35417.1 unnamed protein product [Vitrella brassicaformis CCMP3155]